jgi:hypothetical protein
MRRALLVFITLIADLAPFASTQEHGQVGVYADYLRLSQTMWRTRRASVGKHRSISESKCAIPLFVVHLCSIVALHAV